MTVMVIMMTITMMMMCDVAKYSYVSNTAVNTPHLQHLLILSNNTVAVKILD